MRLSESSLPIGYVALLYQFKYYNQVPVGRIGQPVLHLKSENTTDV